MPIGLLLIEQLNDRKRRTDKAAKQNSREENKKGQGDAGLELRK